MSSVKFLPCVASCHVNLRHSISCSDNRFWCWCSFLHSMVPNCLESSLLIFPCLSFHPIIRLLRRIAVFAKECGLSFLNVGNCNSVCVCKLLSKYSILIALFISQMLLTFFNSEIIISLQRLHNFSLVGIFHDSLPTKELAQFNS